MTTLLEAAHAGRDPLAVLAGHRDALARYEALAEDLLAQGRGDDAAGAIRMGAALAASNHPGVLASPRMEAVLGTLARDHLPPLPARRAPAAPQRVLLVVTETHEVGGHTRLLWRWITRDPGRVHTVVTTGQVGVMPAGVAAAARASGGDVVDLPPAMPVLERAAALRALAADADVVVLLDHPPDPVPTLALAGLEDRPPVVLVNHGDHLFWLGRTIADVVLCLRPVGASIASERRGVPAARCLSTPFPVAGADGHGRALGEPVDAETRAAARANVLGQLGWPQDAVVLATAGSAYKYEGREGLRLIDLVEPVLAAHPNAYLVAAGPGDEGAWRAARVRTNGRVAAVGPLPEGLGTLFAAADVYLESRPLCGPGATAEAAAHGLPALTVAATPLERDIFTTDPAYGTTIAEDVAGYRRMLGELIADGARRAELGERARLAVGAGDDSWGACVERAYALAAELAPVGDDELAPPADDRGDYDVLIDMAHAASAQNVAPVVVERLVTQAELATRSPAVRALLGPLDYPQLLGRYGLAFAAPGAEPAALRAVIAEFRALAAAAVVERFTLALRPADADAAIGVLEAALAEGADVDVDLVLEDDPAAACPPGALEVAVDGEPGPHRHVLKVAAAAPTLP